MNLVPPGFGRPPHDDEQASLAPRVGAADRDSLERQWLALHRAAAAVAALTPGLNANDVALSSTSSASSPLSESPGLPEAPGLPASLSRLDDRRWRLVEEGLGDLVAIMEPGLTALLTIHQRGGDIAAPARALWREFTAARAALLALAEAGGPRWRA